MPLARQYPTRCHSRRSLRATQHTGRRGYGDSRGPMKRREKRRPSCNERPCKIYCWCTRCALASQPMSYRLRNVLRLRRSRGSRGHWAGESACRRMQSRCWNSRRIWVCTVGWRRPLPPLQQGLLLLLQLLLLLVPIPPLSFLPLCLPSQQVPCLLGSEHLTRHLRLLLLPALLPSGWMPRIPCSVCYR